MPLEGYFPLLASWIHIRGPHYRQLDPPPSFQVMAYDFIQQVAKPCDRMAAATTKGRQGAIRGSFGPTYEVILSSLETDKIKDKTKDKTTSKTKRKHKSDKSETETIDGRYLGYGT